MNLDPELRRALKRQEPSKGFADRVLTELYRTGADQLRRGARSRALVITWFTGVAASVLIAVGAVQYWTHQQAVHRAERITHDVDVALRVTSDKLSKIQVKLAELSARRGANDDNRHRR